ncbi:MAG: choice-of-anchor D domain-containing protein [Balneolales bacterium]|nr:choice-of-anchor D domain-containing protein [Balneolales bacterium]
MKLGISLTHLIVVLLLIPELLPAQVFPTNEWINIYSDGNVYVNNELALPGDTVKAYDNDGVLSGQFIIESEGKFGLMAVYRDDPLTELDEGADPGDVITFRINNINAITDAGPVQWTSNGDVIEVGLSVVGADFQLSQYSIDFGEMRVKTIAETTIKLESSGINDLVIDSVVTVYNTDRQLVVNNISGTFSNGNDASLSIKYYPIVGNGEVNGSIQIHSNAFSGNIFSIPIKATLVNDVIPTNEWINVYGDGGTFVGGRELIPGDVIDAFDQSGVHCGTFTVKEDGKFGMMSIYRDDQFTQRDEGLEPGEEIVFTINGFLSEPVDGNPVLWNEHGDLLELALTTISDNFWPELLINFPEISVPQLTESYTVTDNYTAHFSDPEGEELSYSFVSDNDLITLVVDGNGISIEIDESFYGESSIYIIVDDGTYTIPFEIPIEVQKGVPFILTNHSEVNFGDVLITETRAISVNLTNTGNADLVIHNSHNESTEIISTLSDTTLHSGESLTFSIEVHPQNVQVLTDTLYIQNNTELPVFKIPIYANVKLSNSVEDNTGLPGEFILHQNYPNPFNPSTLISFDVPKTTAITLKVFDVLGNEVATLLNNSPKNAGSHTIGFDASTLSSGVYIYIIEAGGLMLTRKMTLIK